MSSKVSFVRIKLETKLIPQGQEFLNKLAGAGFVTVNENLMKKLTPYKVLKNQGDIEQLKKLLELRKQASQQRFLVRIDEQELKEDTKLLFEPITKNLDENKLATQKLQKAIEHSSKKFSTLKSIAVTSVLVEKSETPALAVEKKGDNRFTINNKPFSLDRKNIIFDNGSPFPAKKHLLDFISNTNLLEIVQEKTIVI